MTIANIEQVIVITQPKALVELADKLIHERIIAVDTESNSLYAYRERVCLVQFSTSSADYLVDPLVIKDLSPLGPVFASPHVEKVFHAAEYDLICLSRDYSFQFNHLFDTMVASRILGRETVGLGDLLQGYFNVHIDKHYQRANWGQRPLPADLLDYARFDTHYLIELRDRLAIELEQRDLLALANEDFNRLVRFTNGERPLTEKSPDFWQIKGASDLDPRGAAILRELCRYRESVAQASDRPLFKVINDRTLVSIASSTPTTLRDLSRVEGMTQGQIQRHGNQIINAVKRGQKAEPLYPVHQPRRDESYIVCLDRLRRWRKEIAQTMAVQSDVILPRDLMEALAESKPRNMEELSRILSEVPWRVEHFGDQILKTLGIEQ